MIGQTFTFERCNFQFHGRESCSPSARSPTRAKTVATGKKVDELVASNAVEHAAFLEAVTDHEVRSSRLETPPESAPS